MWDLQQQDHGGASKYRSGEGNARRVDGQALTCQYSTFTSFFHVRLLIYDVEPFVAERD